MKQLIFKKDTGYASLLIITVSLLAYIVYLDDVYLHLIR